MVSQVSPFLVVLVMTALIRQSDASLGGTRGMPGEEVPMFSRKLDHIGCINTVNEVEILTDDDEWDTVECKDTPGKKNKDEKFCLRHDRLTEKLVLEVCPQMCNIPACDEDASDGRSFNDEFTFKCENQRDQVLVMDSDSEPTFIDCGSSPNADSQMVCFQMDQLTDLVVWKVCPLHCMVNSCSEFGPMDRCANKVQELKVIKNEKEKIIDCDNESDKKTDIFCRQFDAYSEQIVFTVCPKMCPEHSLCE